MIYTPPLLCLLRWYKKSFNLELQTTHDMSGRISHPEESARKIEWIVDHLVRMQNILCRTFRNILSLTHTLTHTHFRTRHALLITHPFLLSSRSGPLLSGVLTVHDHGMQVLSPRYRLSQQVNIVAITTNRQVFHFLGRFLTKIDSFPPFSQLVLNQGTVILESSRDVNNMLIFLITHSIFLSLSVSICLSKYRFSSLRYLTLLHYTTLSSHDIISHHITSQTSIIRPSEDC